MRISQRARRLCFVGFILLATNSIYYTSPFARTMRDEQARTADRIVIKAESPNELKLPFGGTLALKAEVYDKQGNRLQATPVQWRLANAEHKPFIYIGSIVNDATTNSVELVWRPGPAGSKPPSAFQLVAWVAGALAIETIKYESPAREEAVITFMQNDKEVPGIEVQPGSTETVKVVVRAKEDQRILKDVEVSAELSDPEMAKLVKVIGPDKDNSLTLVGLFGDSKKPIPFRAGALVVRTRQVTQTLPMTYRGVPVKTVWSILPSEIVGDNFGRTIKKNYFCAEVTIENYSGSDIALAGLVFERKIGEQTFYFPVSSYSTVRGSLAKRKLTHPRTLTLAIVDGVGSLMTGFVPFFHNDAHKANYSTFIDVISNPLAKGLASVWKDAYPDEVARFEQDVLKDDKNIANGATFKTKVFFPKRLLFEDKDKGRDNPEEVRKRLGQLIVLGYKFQKGALTDLSRTP